MQYQEAKQKFINTWGSLGSLWGINKAMAQIQALLFISPQPLSMEDIMEELKISRGNTSTNLRQLIDWGIVTKELVAGERKEFFTTEKDVQELARIVAKERSRREIKPVIKVLKDVSNIENDGSKQTEEWIQKKEGTKERNSKPKTDICIQSYENTIRISLKSGKGRLTSADCYETNAIFLSVLETSKYNSNIDLKKIEEPFVIDEILDLYEMKREESMNDGSWVNRLFTKGKSKCPFARIIY